jgi:hypothetical protein
MATIYKIHPAIGIARLGNSPDEFFIGPQRIGERPNPAGGFKDSQCRVKRQAARFHIFAHHDDGTVEEITSAKADITWTVHLANKKGPNHGVNTEPAADVTIDPGPRQVNGPDQRQVFDTGTIKFAAAPVTTVPLGEIRSDHDNHLLVLGGFGTSASPRGDGLAGYFWASKGWYDDTSDGPVTATIKLKADGTTPPVVGAWVLCTPPKFAPYIDSVITMYDRVFQAMVDGALITAPTKTSYTKDVYPILQRARDTRWVVDIPAGVMTWPDPVTSDALRTAIFSSLTAPGAGAVDMPPLFDSGTLDNRLTPVQYAHMKRWNDNNYTNDWGGPPPPEADISPDGLDRAALEACVGAAFYPGIEAGGLQKSDQPAGVPVRPIIDPANYSEPFRLKPALSPGDITLVMALPWQNDFWQCQGGGGTHWWPVPRPDNVIRGGSSQSWTSDPSGSVASGTDMVDNWHMLGFVVPQGTQEVEAERCVTPSITLLTPLLNFQDVPQGPMGMVREVPLAITFEVVSPSGPVTLQYAPGGAPMHPQLVAFNSSVTVGPTPANGIVDARLWIIYRTSSVGDVLPAQQVTVQQQGTANQWNITILGNTVARKTAAAALTLDRSGSMAQDRGDGQTRHASLQQAASIFVDVMLEGDGVGLVSFNQASQVLQPVLKLGAGGLSDLNRSATKDIINGNGLDPLGSTSIGNGIYDARGILNTAPDPYDVKTLVVLTDGIENTAKFIADVAPQINEQTYAIGIGTPQNTSAPALQAISGNHGGFLLITGAIGTDNRFLLQKYFLQILAGVSDADVVLDPDGQLIPGRVEKIPFQMIQGDAGVEVILLTPYPKVVDFRLQTPSGRIIEPWLASSTPGMRYVESAGVSFYRLVLPLQLEANRFDQSGVWHALLSIGQPRTARTQGSRDGADLTILDRLNAPPVRQPAPPRGVAARNLIASRTTELLFTAANLTPAATAVGQRTLPYSLIVHAYSNISLQAHASQTSFEPGAQIALHATLTQSGVPVTQGAQVFAEITRPDKTMTVVNLTAQEDAYSANFATTLGGVYHFRVRARGATPRGEVFARERSLTAGVWMGGNQSADPNRLIDYLRGRDQKLCDLLTCLTQGGAITPALEEHLRAQGFDLAQARKCLSILCTGVHKDPTKDE